MFSKRSGFTLLELIVVMAVIALLVGVGVPRFIGYQKEAGVTAMQADCKVLEDACMICYTEDDAWPTADVYGPVGSIAELLSSATACKLKKSAVSSHIRSLKNGLDSYVLVTEGNGNISEGSVVYVGSGGNGLEDRSGKVWYGISLRGIVGDEPAGGLRDPESDEFQVWTDSDLCKVGSGEDGWNMDSKYIQMSHIDLSGYADGEGWEPIGDDMYNKFAGSFDGNGFTISNLKISRPDTNYQGLFGCTGSGAKLSNISLEFVNVKGNQYVGGLVGWNSDGGRVISSYSTGSVKGDNNYVGGLVGYNNGEITSSYSTASVEGDQWHVGGLVGCNNGEITSSYSTASVKGDKDVGGLVGRNYGTITSSYSTASVKGDDDYVGGLVGRNNGEITSSYSTGSVEGDQYVGGLVGRSFSEITSSYWDTETSGQSESAGGVGKTTVEMQQESTFEDWDFDIVWGIDEGESYPYLRNNEQVPHPQ